MELQGVTRVTLSYRVLRGGTDGLQRVTRVTEHYRGVKRVTGGYKGLLGVTGSSRGLQGATGITAPDVNK